MAVATTELAGRDEIEAPIAPGLRRATLSRVLRRVLLEHKLAAVGLVVIVAVVLFCFVGPLLYHTDQLEPNLLDVNLAPSASHLLGTDGTGFDILGRLMLGGQSSIEVGVSVGVLATAIGVVWGTVAGLVAGAVDSILMRVADIFLAVPTIFIFIFLASVLRPSLLLLILILSAVWWVGPSRLVRGEALTLRTREFVEACVAMGGKRRRVIFRHILPNALAVIVVQVTFMIADSILVLATLSFLGFGLPPPAVTWGGMLSNGTQYLFAGYWWQIYPVGIVIVITVTAFNFLGDAMRDAFDVRLIER